MNCRCCKAEVRGDTCEPPKALLSTGAYTLLVNCACGASLGIVMWLSECEAEQRHLEDKRYQEHRAAMSALVEARESGAPAAVLRRLEWREERLAQCE